MWLPYWNFRFCVFLLVIYTCARWKFFCMSIENNCVKIEILRKILQNVSFYFSIFFKNRSYRIALRPWTNRSRTLSPSLSPSSWPLTAWPPTYRRRRRRNLTRKSACSPSILPCPTTRPSSTSFKTALASSRRGSPAVSTIAESCRRGSTPLGKLGSSVLCVYV